MTSNTPQHGTPRRAFTIVEIMISVFIIAVLMGLLLYGVALTSRMAKGKGHGSAVTAVKAGVSRFSEEFGFLPPLVRDKRLPQSPTNILRPVQVGGENVNRLNIYRPTVAQDMTDLRAQSLGASPNPDPNNPFYDERYSEVSLAAYLAGGLNVTYKPTGNSPPIDGVQGPGFAKPDREGGWVLSGDMLADPANGAASKRSGTVYAPLVQLDKPSLKLVVNPQDGKRAVLADLNGVPIRYYRWEPGQLYNNKIEVRNQSDLNIPWLVGRDSTALAADPVLAALLNVPADRDLSVNTTLRDSRYAIVGAGPNGVFGDESIDVIATKLGRAVPTNTSQTLKLRRDAEADNVVEVGK